VLVELDVLVFTTARGVLNREDRDLLCSLVDQVIDKIAVFGRHEFADAFDILGTTVAGKRVRSGSERSIAALTASAADGL
jgi:hypothetical protein